MALYAFDGTWNFRDQKEAIDHVQSAQYGVDQAPRRDTVETNVHRFIEFYGEDRSEYLQGVGTRFSWLGRLFGGAFGAGGRYRIRRMYRSLTKRYFAGDQDIDIVGFSRGAALAVHFANVLASHGLRNPANPRHLAWWYYPDLGWTFRHPKPTASDIQAPRIDFLGLWDTVATFGVPVWPFRNRSRKWKVWTIPENVQHSFHAMALDEVRATFALVRPKPVLPKTVPPAPANKNTHYEVWFRGVHSNIGGGYLDRGLSDIALAWMMEMALWAWRKLNRPLPVTFVEALRMLDPDPGPPPSWVGSSLETLEPDPNGVLARPMDLRRRSWRELSTAPLIHHSLFLRNPNLVSDHYSSNRQLLRRIPGNARPVHDPPMFYENTARKAAERLAADAFGYVPVRPVDWLIVDGHSVFRSDHWIALGSKLGRADPNGWVERMSRSAFVQIATDWILNDQPSDPKDLNLTEALRDEDGKIIEDPEPVKAWGMRVLLQLDPYMPRQR